MATLHSSFVCLFLTVTLLHFSGSEIPPKEYELRRVHKVSWLEAMLSCQKEGKSLATINNQAEQVQLQETVSLAGGWLREYWIGGTNLGIPSNQYFWYGNTSKPLTYANWDIFEPNNLLGVEHCLQIWKTPSVWNDRSCDTKLFFVCQNHE